MGAGAVGMRRLRNPTTIKAPSVKDVLYCVEENRISGLTSFLPALNDLHMEEIRQTSPQPLMDQYIIDKMYTFLSMYECSS